MKEDHIFCFWKLVLKWAPIINQLLYDILFSVSLEILANEKTNGKSTLQFIINHFPIATTGLGGDQLGLGLGDQFYFVTSLPLQYHKKCHWDYVSL